jgi:hypothetical protein
VSGLQTGIAILVVAYAVFYITQCKCKNTTEFYQEPGMKSKSQESLNFVFALI